MSMMIKKNQLTLAALVMLSLNACASLSNKQDPAVSDAIKALRRIEAAVQVGVNFQQYGQLLIEAKSQVNEASAKLPDGELKRELNEAMEAYVDAGRVWNNKIQGYMILADSEPGKTVIPKYSLRTTTESRGRQEANADEAIQVIWRVAKEHLERAAALIQK